MRWGLGGSLAPGAALEMNQNAEPVVASGGLKGRRGFSLVEHISGSHCCHISAGRRIPNSTPAAFRGLVSGGRGRVGRSREIRLQCCGLLQRLEGVLRQRAPL